MVTSVGYHSEGLSIEESGSRRTGCDGQGQDSAAGLPGKPRVGEKLEGQEGSVLPKPAVAVQERRAQTVSVRRAAI